jgi:hypothetical protein
MDDAWMARVTKGKKNWKEAIAAQHSGPQILKKI